MRLYSIKKRAFALLEVMIAFALVALCALPLVYPHIAILKAEKAFVADIELDHMVSLLYAEILQKLYLNEIEWSQITSDSEKEIGSDLTGAIGLSDKLPFKGVYKFKEVKHKPPKAKDKGVYLFDLIFEFKPLKAKDSEKALVYPYKVMIEKK